MLNYVEEKSSSMNGAFYRKFLWEVKKLEVFREEKMEKAKVRKELNVELFIVE